jgi:hypothetical protein
MSCVFAGDHNMPICGSAKLDCQRTAAGDFDFYKHADSNV